MGRGSEFAAPSTVSAGEVDGKLPHGLGPLARAEREISQVKTSKARSSQFRETRSQARTSAVRTSSANAAMTPREPFPVPATASTSSTSAASESAAFPARARSKSGVLTKEEEEIKRKVLQDALERASNYQVETKVDKKKQFPLTVRHENERYGGQSDRSFDQVPFPVTTNELDLRRPVDREKLNTLYQIAGK